MKRIVVCMDGTWNKPTQYDRGKRKPTNVVKIARAIDPVCQDGIHQVVYYSEGVGTQWGLDRILGGGFGIGLSKNIIKAYRFIVHNYQPGDEIFLFGFSRGAYTVRSLAGLINQVGLLPKNQAFYMPEAYRLYRESSSNEQLKAFQLQHNTIQVKIKFVGVWDTVGALGVPIKCKQFNQRYQFHDVSLTSNIEHAFQALAIDEHRGVFKPAIWQLPKGSLQTLQQQWFVGSHSNIGGGYSQDGLANISLHWIKNMAQHYGLQFDETFLSYHKPCHLDEYRDSMTWFYKFNKVIRTINDKPDTHESLNESVIRRIEDLPTYRPKNVLPIIASNNPKILS
jgi:uncharacterized protein (DUF2235 family)